MGASCSEMYDDGWRMPKESEKSRKAREVLDACRLIVSDEQVTTVHGGSNFGSQTPRQVVNEGVLKSAFGYSHGSTAFAILREHKLINKESKLTGKGFRYLRALDIYGDAKGTISGYQKA